MDGKTDLKWTLAILLGAVLLITMFFAVIPTVSAATGCFPDTNGHLMETFICWMKDNGITAGYGDGTYRPNNGVTRAEMAVFIQRVYELVDPYSILGDDGYLDNNAGTDLLTRTQADSRYSYKGSKTQARFSFIIFEDDMASPLAHATVQTDGTFGGSTYVEPGRTMTVSWNSSMSRYEISISGISYHYNNYTTLVSTIESNMFCEYGSVSGDLLITCWNLQ